MTLLLLKVEATPSYIAWLRFVVITTAEKGYPHHHHHLQVSCHVLRSFIIIVAWCVQVCDVVVKKTLKLKYLLLHVKLMNVWSCYYNAVMHANSEV